MPPAHAGDGDERKIQPNQTQEALGGGAELALESRTHPGKLEEEVKLAGLPDDLCLFLLGVVPGPLGNPAVLLVLPQVGGGCLECYC